MGIIEIIAAFLLILSCIFIIVVVLMQESKQGMSNVITGGSSDNYYQKNSGRTKEAKLAKATKTAAIVLFVVAIAVNVISVYWNGSSETANNSTPVVTVADDDTEDVPEVTDAEETTASETTAPAEETTAEVTTAAAE